jgi:hypothetical protein
MKQDDKRAVKKSGSGEKCDLKPLNELLNKRIISGEAITSAASNLSRSWRNRGLQVISYMPDLVNAGGYRGEELPVRYTFLEAAAACCWHVLRHECKVTKPRIMIELMESLKQVIINAPDVFLCYCYNDHVGEFVLDYESHYAKYCESLKNTTPFNSYPLLPVVQSVWAACQNSYPNLCNLSFTTLPFPPANITGGLSAREQYLIDLIRNVELRNNNQIIVETKETDIQLIEYVAKQDEQDIPKLIKKVKEQLNEQNIDKVSISVYVTSVYNEGMRANAPSVKVKIKFKR